MKKSFVERYGRRIAMAAAGALTVATLILIREAGPPYAMQPVNYGQHGVVVLEMGYHSSHVVTPGWAQEANKTGLEGEAIVWALTPTFPLDSWPGALMPSRFDQHEASLPDEVEVVWQLAELDDCLWSRSDLSSDRLIREIKSRGYDPKNHISKRDCHWRPIPGRIYRQRLDIAAVRNSEAYRTVDSLSNRFTDKYSLRLLFVFNEDQLKVETYKYGGNRWS